MGSSLEELAARLSALEDEVRRIGDQAAAARQTQVEHGARIETHSRKLDDHGRLIESLDEDVRTGFSETGEEMRDGFAKLAVGQVEIRTLLRHIADPESGDS